MKKEKYGYAESSALAATNGDGHIYSVIDNDNDLENGMLVTLDEVIDMENYSVRTPAQTDGVVLILDVIIPYDQSTSEAAHEYYYKFDAGTSTRAYNLIKNDRYAIADYMVTTIAGEGNPAVKGNYLVVNTANRKYTEVAKSQDFNMESYGFVAEIVDIVSRSNLTLYRLRVLKNLA